MSTTASLVHSFQKVGRSINNEAKNRSPELAKYNNNRDAIARLAESINEPYSNERLIEHLQRKAIYTPLRTKGSTKEWHAPSLGTLGEQINTNDIQGAINSLYATHAYSSDKTGKALVQSFDLGKDKITNKIIAFVMQRGIEIPEMHFQRMLATVSKQKNIKNLETVLTFDRAHHMSKSRKPKDFTQRITKSINDELVKHAKAFREVKDLGQKQNHLAFMTEVVVLLSNLGNDYYDSNLDEIGLSKVEHFLDGMHTYTGFKIVESLDDMRSRPEVNIQSLDPKAREEYVIRNTKEINQRVLKRLDKNPKSALDIFGKTLSYPIDSYDIKKDPQALGLIEAKLPRVLPNPNLSNQSNINVLKGFRAIFKTYNNTLNEEST